MNPETAEKLKNIKFLLLDLQGVILSGEPSQTDEVKRQIDLFFSDVSEARQMGLKTGIISQSSLSEIPGLIRESGVDEVFAETMDKLSQAESLAVKYGLSLDEIGYIGDDILDIPLLSRTGFSAAPHHARREVKRVVSYVCRSDTLTPLREVLELIGRQKELKGQSG